MAPVTVTPGGLLLLLRTLFQLFLASPQQACALVHRDAQIAGAYYLYCVQITADGTEMISVGRFVPDAKKNLQ